MLRSQPARTKTFDLAKASVRTKSAGQSASEYQIDNGTTALSGMVATPNVRTPSLTASTSARPYAKRGRSPQERTKVLTAGLEAPIEPETASLRSIVPVTSTTSNEEHKSHSRVTSRRSTPSKKSRTSPGLVVGAGAGISPSTFAERAGTSQSPDNLPRRVAPNRLTLLRRPDLETANTKFSDREEVGDHEIQINAAKTVAKKPRITSLGLMNSVSKPTTHSRKYTSAGLRQNDDEDSDTDDAERTLRDSIRSASALHREPSEEGQSSGNEALQEAASAQLLNDVCEKPTQINSPSQGLAQMLFPADEIDILAAEPGLEPNHLGSIQICRPSRTETVDDTLVKTRGASPPSLQIPILLNLEAFKAGLRRHQKTMWSDKEYLMRPALRQAKLDCISAPGPELESSLPDPFDGFIGSSFSLNEKQSETQSRAHLQMKVFNSSYQHTDGKVSFENIDFESAIPALPKYKSIVRLGPNVLAKNDMTLKYLPYFFEKKEFTDHDQKELHDELEKRYKNRIDTLPARRKCRELADYWRECVEDYLEWIDLDLDDLISFLTLPSQPDGFQDLQTSLSPEAFAASRWRESICPSCEAPVGSKAWANLISYWDREHKPLSDGRKMALAGLACQAFLGIARFSLWHIVSTAPSTLEFIRRSKWRPREQASTLCLVCYLHDCPSHGAYLEHAVGSGTESEGTGESDNDGQLGHNFRQRVTLPDQQGAGNDDVRISESKRTHLTDLSLTRELQERIPFTPCSHPGPCDKTADCLCHKSKVSCERSCGCSNNCGRRYQGCKCVARGKKVCFADERCECWHLNRECDPWLCGRCGVLDVLDPVNRYNESVQEFLCKNAKLQLDMPRRTLKGRSDIHGWGLFAGEDIKKTEYIGEYKGEIIGEDEMFRRGAVYHHRGVEYLFKLNKDQDVDSSRAGNKIRFINNSKKHANLLPKLMFCNGVQRIMLYAKQDIKAGEELYFEYGYKKEVTKFFWEPGEGGPGRSHDSNNSENSADAGQNQGKGKAVGGSVYATKKIRKKGIGQKIPQSRTKRKRIEEDSQHDPDPQKNIPEVLPKPNRSGKGRSDLTADVFAGPAAGSSSYPTAPEIAESEDDEYQASDALSEGSSGDDEEENDDDNDADDDDGDETGLSEGADDISSRSAALRRHRISTGDRRYGGEAQRAAAATRRLKASLIDNNSSSSNTNNRTGSLQGSESQERARKTRGKPSARGSYYGTGGRPRKRGT